MFALLLALVGQQLPEEPAGQTEPQPSAAGLTLSVPVGSTETAAVAGEANVQPAGQASRGNSLLKELGDALIALNDALEANKPVSPALRKKLAETIDAAIAYFGIPQPVPEPAIDPAISALASGAGILPPVQEAAPGTPPSYPDTLPAADSAAPEAPGDPAAPIESSASFVPAAPLAPAQAEPNPAQDIVPVIGAAGTDIVTQVAGAMEELAEAVTPSAQPQAEEPAPQSGQATAPVAAHPDLKRLAQMVGKLADGLEPAAPELAKKLEALAAGFEATSAEAGTASAGEDPEVSRIVAALAAPRPAPTRATDQPFTAPSLELPETVLPKGKADDTVPEPASSGTRSSDSVPLELAPVKKPGPTTPVVNEAKPSAGSEPAAAVSQPNATAPADTAAQSGAVTPATTQPAAPVARTVHAAYQAAVQQVNLPQVAFEVVRHFEAGNSRFQIRLDPPELGRIDVKLDVDKAGTVNARMVVERPETLDLMQRDQRALQQALQQAGLDASRTNLEFSLRQNPFAAQGGMGDGRGQQPAFGGGDGLGNEDVASTEAAATLYRGTATAGGVNLFV